MLLDCRDLSFELRIVPRDWAVVVTDSGVTRGLVDGEDNTRRRQCEVAAQALSLASLRDASVADIEAAGLDDIIRRRALHVATQLDASISRINGGVMDDVFEMPFAGVKAAGYGRLGVRAAIDQFTELRWITVASARST